MSGVQLRFEAAVAGVVPVIRVIQESLAATEITKVFGIVNGTTNFILTEMASTGASYADALRRAQELGYAEADPSDDVGGADAAAKMAILARLAFGSPVALADVSYEGITEIQPDDIAYAKELGLSLKLLGVAERRDGGISVRVFPCFLYAAPSPGADRGTVQRGDGGGAGDHRDHHVGAGSGRGRDRLRGARRRGLDPLGQGSRARGRESLEIVRDISSSFYLHLEVADRPGVLAQVADVLGRNEVSVQQRRPAGAGGRGATGDGHARGPGVVVLQGARRDRGPGVHPRPAARDPGDRGRVRVKKNHAAVASPGG